MVSASSGVFFFFIIIKQKTQSNVNTKKFITFILHSYI